MQISWELVLLLAIEHAHHDARCLLMALRNRQLPGSYGAGYILVSKGGAIEWEKTYA